MNTALLIAQLLNQAAPGVAEIVMMVRKKDGTLTIMPLLDEASDTFAANLESAKAWLGAHPAP